MKHYVYRLDDPITNEFYIGSRSCNCNIDDDTYMGSYYTWKPEDKSRLIKTILKSDFGEIENCVNYEAELIREYIDDDLNRNYYIPNSGFHRLGSITSSEHKQKISESNKGKLPWNTGLRGAYVTSDKTKQKLSDSTKRIWDSMTDEEKNHRLRNSRKSGPEHHYYGKIWYDSTGTKHSDETKKKMSESHKGIVKDEVWRTNLSKSLTGKSKSKEHIAKLRECHKIPVLQYTKDGEFIKEWAGACDAMRELNIHQISSVCKGKQKSAGGFTWKYKNK